MKTDLSHNRRSFRFFAALLCALLMAASAYATDYGDVSVKVETVTSGLSEPGYSEYRATITNHSSTKSHRVTIELLSNAYGGDAEARRTVEVAPSSMVTVAMVKLEAIHSDEVRVLIDGARQDAKVEVDISRTNAWVSRSVNVFFLLVSRDVEKSGLMNDAAVSEGFKNAAGENDVAYLAYKAPMPEWSANWVGYSGFDGVILTADELRAAPEAVRSALWRYVECGGSLLVIGEWEIPKQWQSRRGTVGDGYYVGFGQVIAIDAAEIKQVSPTYWSDIKRGWHGSRHSGKTYFHITDINKDFPVVERIGIPVRGL
ncbi:MAG: hypothetical protein ACREAB_06865, partial [Blastocatellia bacterium]